jgi:hypothetical protein
MLFAFNHAGTGDEKELASADGDVAKLERTVQILCASGNYAFTLSGRRNISTSSDFRSEFRFTRFS